MRQAETLALGTAGQKNSGHRGGLSDAIGNNIRFNKPHRIEDGKTSRNRTTRGIDVQRDIPFRIFRCQKQHLGDDQVRYAIIDRSAEKDDVFLQQARINVVGTLSSRRLLNHHRHKHRIIHPILLSLASCSSKKSAANLIIRDRVRNHHGKSESIDEFSISAHSIESISFLPFAEWSLSTFRRLKGPIWG
jgi:hypothetical protein